MKIDKINLQNATKAATKVGFKASERKDLSLGNSAEFSKNSSMGITTLGKSQISKTVSKSQPLAGSLISFTGGNKSQVVHLAAEGAVTKGGGVATVINDWIKGWSKFAEQEGGFETQHNFFFPYYNGDVLTVNGITHTFVQQDKDGNMFFVSGVDSIDEVTETKGTKTLLKKLFTSTINDVDPDGKLEQVEYTIYEATDSISKEILPEGNNSRIFIAASPKLTTMVKQYTTKTAGDYAYIGGDQFDAYAQGDRVVIHALAHHSKELSLEAPTKAISGNYIKMDPGAIVFHDWHNAVGASSAFREAKAGNKMFEDMAYQYVGHNMGRGGYQGLGSPEYVIFKNVATPEQYVNLINSKKYKEIMSKVGPEGDRQRAEFWAKLMPEMIDEAGVPNPSMIPIKLAQKEFLNMTVVSGGYCDEITSNPEYAGGLTVPLQEARSKGHLFGITNGLVKPTNDTQISKLNCTYYSPQYFETLDDATKSKFKYADGTPIKPMRIFDYNNLNIDEVTEVKKANKYNYLERLINYTQGKINEKDLPEGIKPVHLVTTKDRDAKIMSTLTDNVLKDLQGENPPKLFVSWGRGTEQKGFDEVLMAIDKFVGSKEDDGKSIFAICGGLGNDGEASRIRKLIDKLMSEKNDRMKDRFVYIDGWGPADAMASAGDYAIFASRFEPCGLTPQEGYQRGCIAIGTKTGGMRKSIIDYSAVDKAEKATGFQTSTAYYDIEHCLTVKDKEGKNVVNQEFIDKIKATPEGQKFLAKFDKLKAKAKKEAERFNKIAEREKETVGENVFKPTDEASIIDAAKSYPEFGSCLRDYRDDVMSNDLAKQFKRAVDLPAEDMAAMRKFCIERPMDWINNLDVNGGEKSAFALHAACMGMGPKPVVTKLAKDIDFNGFVDEKELQLILSENFTGAVNNVPSGSGVAQDLLQGSERTAVGFMGKLKKVQEYVQGNKLATALALCATALAGVWIYNGIRARKLKPKAPAPSIKAKAAPAAPAIKPAPATKIASKGGMQSFMKNTK